MEDNRRLWKSLDPEIVPYPSRKKLASFLRKLPSANAAILCVTSGADMSSFVM
jgi:hypothetical protein